MGKFTVFIDESGNTGCNLLDFNQPIFTFVGVGINNEQMIPILRTVEEIKSKYGFRPNDKLHAKRLDKKRRYPLTREIIELLMEYKFSMFVSIVEKKFTIATYVADDFFDPVYNHYCDNNWTLPYKKNERANFIYNHLSDEAVDACGKAFGTGTEMRQAYELVKKSIAGKSYEIDLSGVLAGAEPYLDKIGQAIKEANSANEELGIASGVAQSPNFFSFMGLLNKIENYYSLDESNLGELVFESSRQFNVAFKYFFRKLRDAPKVALHFHDRTPLLFGYNHLREFVYKRREDSLFLQLADLAASSTKEVVQKVYLDKGKDIYSEFECFIMFLVVEHWQQFKDLFSDFVISDSLAKKLFRTLYDKNRMEVLRKSIPKTE